MAVAGVEVVEIAGTAGPLADGAEGDLAQPADFQEQLRDLRGFGEIDLQLAGGGEALPGAQCGDLGGQLRRGEGRSEGLLPTDRNGARGLRPAAAAEQVGAQPQVGDHFGGVGEGGQLLRRDGTSRCASAGSGGAC